MRVRMENSRPRLPPPPLPEGGCGFVQRSASYRMDNRASRRAAASLQPQEIDFEGFLMVLPERFELSTSPLPRECSTPELRQRSSMRRTSATETAGAQALPAQFFRLRPCHENRSGPRDSNGVDQRRPAPMAQDGNKDGKTPAEERRQRLAAQLRANLQRRKAQSRARRAGETDPRPSGLPAADGPGPDEDR